MVRTVASFVKCQQTKQENRIEKESMKEEKGDKIGTGSMQNLILC
jgi:hypothetical protein